MTGSRIMSMSREALRRTYNQLRLEIDGTFAEMARFESQAAYAAHRGMADEWQLVEWLEGRFARVKAVPRSLDYEVRERDGTFDIITRPEPETVAKAKAEILGRYDRNAKKARDASPETQRDPIASRRLKQGLNLLHLRGERLLDDKRGRAILETLISLGLSEDDAKARAPWMPPGCWDAVRRNPRATDKVTVGQVFELVWEEKRHPWVLAFHIEALDETPELRADWKRERRRLANRRHNAKRPSKRKPPAPAPAPDKLPPRAQVVLGAAEREWLAVMKLADKVRAANEFRQKGARSKPNSATIQRAVRRIVDDLIAAGWLDERVDVTGSVKVRYVRLPPLRSHPGGGRPEDKKATTSDPIAADKTGNDQ
jgi:hypothetical protein